MARACTLLALALARAALAAEVEVDWRINLESTTLDVAEGDTIVFKWSGVHDVFEMPSAAALEACSFVDSGAVELPSATDGGSSVVRVEAPPAGEQRFYACSVGAHCQLGMGITITSSGGPAVCVDSASWTYVAGDKGPQGCDHVAELPEKRCDRVGEDGVSAKDACCQTCLGVDVIPTPHVQPTPRPSADPTSRPTAQTPRPTNRPTKQPTTARPTPEPSATPTPRPTPDPTPLFVPDPLAPFCPAVLPWEGPCPSEVALCDADGLKAGDACAADGTCALKGSGTLCSFRRRRLQVSGDADVFLVVQAAPTRAPTLAPSPGPTPAPSAQPTPAPSRYIGGKKKKSGGSDDTLPIIIGVVAAVAGLIVVCAALFYCSTRKDAEPKRRRSFKPTTDAEAPAPPVVEAGKAGPAKALEGELALPEDTTLKALLDIGTVSRKKADAGAAEARGWRPAMEDAYVVDAKTVPDAAVLAVFDGHGGRGVAAFAAAELAPRLSKALKRDKTRRRFTWEPEGDPYMAGETPSAVGDALRDVDVALKDEDIGGSFDEVGATAVVVVVDKKHTTCGWLGDSRAVLATGGLAVPLSRDHKPDDPAEKARVEAAEGYVFQGRVNGALAVTRALGDFSYKAQPHLSPEQQLVSGVPEVTVRARAPADEFVVLACDGIWGEVSDEQACALVRGAYQQGIQDPAGLAKVLVEWALLRGTTDNMTAVVKLLDRAKLNALSESDARDGMQAVGLAFPAALHAAEVLPKSYADVFALEQPELLALMDKCGLGKYKPRFERLQLTGARLLDLAERSFVEDLHMDEKDAKFLALALEWWDLTSSCQK